MTRLNDILIFIAGSADADEICAMSRATREFDVARGYSPQWLTPGTDILRAAIAEGSMRKLVFDRRLLFHS